MAVVPYLYFNGDCEEAMSTYARVFGGEITGLMRMGDMPQDPPLPKEVAKMVMNLTYTMPDGLRFMASDNWRGTSAETSNISLTVEFPDVESTRAAYDALIEGAEIHEPFGPQFWTDAFAAFKDRFHIRWQLTGPYKAM
jgi:PhnB protein